MATEYAVNDVGEVQELRDGVWTKIPQAKDDKGEVIFYTDGKWQPAPIRVQKGLIQSEKAKLVDRALKIGMDPRELFVEANTPMETRLAGLDKGLEDVPYGLRQLAAHVLPGADPTAIDAEIAEREKYAPNNAAQFVGNAMGMFAPGGFGVKVARAVPILGRAGGIWEALVGGAAEGASMPVTGDNFAAEKAMQVGGSAALSGVVTGGIKLGTGGVETAANTVTGRHQANLPGQLSARQVRNGTPMAVEGQRLARQYDVPLTPGQSSDSATLKFLEQRARQSWLSKEAALDGDIVRSQKMRDAIEAQAGNVDSATFATRLQDSVSSFVKTIAENRSAAGRLMYGEVDRAAAGAKVVTPRAFYDTLLDIVDRAGTQETGDIVKAAKQARMILDNIDKQGGYTAREALGRLQSYSPFSQGTVFDEVSKSFDAELKRKMYSALLEDMDSAATSGGNVGELVKRANAAWRKASDNIRSVHKTALGKIAGEDVASDLFNFNTVGPEEVMNKLTKLKPSQATGLVSFLSNNMPDMLPQLRGAILRDAIDDAMELSATAGAQLRFQPDKFLRALGLTGGKSGKESTARLMAYFGGSNSREWAVMSDLIQLSRRLGDVSGKNFSDTAAAQQFTDVLMRGLSGGLGFVKAAASTLVEGMGLRQITKSMDPANAAFGQIIPRPLLQAPMVIKKTALPAGLSAPVIANEREK